MERTVRYRINIARGMKGNISWDATVEITGMVMLGELVQAESDFERDVILAWSDKLVKELESRYPIEKEK